MIISEKGLCKILKREYKQTGYKIIQVEQSTFISADGIVIRMESDAVPRQLLGLLVEHSGNIPVDCSIQVMKGMENQFMLPSAALDLDIHLRNSVKTERTQIILNGYLAVYQCKDNQTFGVRLDQLEVLEYRGHGENPVVDLEKQVAAWYGEHTEVFIPILSKKRKRPPRSPGKPSVDVLTNTKTVQVGTYIV